MFVFRIYIQRIVRNVVVRVSQFAMAVVIADCYFIDESITSVGRIAMKREEKKHQQSK
jgi:hypothetical protein